MIKVYSYYYRASDHKACSFRDDLVLNNGNNYSKNVQNKHD